MKILIRFSLVLTSIIILCGCSGNKAEEEAYNNAVARLDSATVEYKRGMARLRAQGASTPELMIAEINYLQELSQLESDVIEKAEALGH